MNEMDVRRGPDERACAKEQSKRTAGQKDWKNKIIGPLGTKKLLESCPSEKMLEILAGFKR